MEPLERYRKLNLRESFSTTYNYASACNELGYLLRGTYNKVSKNLQAIMFQDTLQAFRVLPEMLTDSGISAANLLLQAAEVTLPKQKRALAVTEFKHAIVAYKRRCKAQQDQEGPAPLPQDVLVHIFSFLDMHSLVAAGLVCWSWNSAARDNMLWQSQYSLLIGDPTTSCESKEQISRLREHQMDKTYEKKKDKDIMAHLDWREELKKKYLGNSLRKSTSNRGYCWHCRSILWISDMNFHHLHALKHKNKWQKIKPLASDQVVAYILDGTCAVSSSDSDSDSDGSSAQEQRLPKLWAYPRRLAR
ncbi:F-box protein At5g52880 [Aristolochia californica]|uniref:F-box protein At5g52880 n=1 Tax=Aristolochia californica TaxID=171875 RepID=UPI0035D54E37